MASVTGPDSVGVPWGQQKKQTTTVSEPSPTPASEPAPTQAAEPESTSPTPEPTQTVQPESTSPAPMAEPALALSTSAAPSTAVAPSPSTTPQAQVKAMPERLRDLIVALRTAGGDETSLERVARELASARSEMAAAAPQQEAMLTAREIIASASTSLVAQANHNRDSVRAILGSV